MVRTSMRKAGPIESKKFNSDITSVAISIDLLKKRFDSFSDEIKKLLLPVQEVMNEIDEDSKRCNILR